MSERKISDQLCWEELDTVDVQIDETVVLVFKRGSVRRNVRISSRQIAEIIEAIKREPNWLRRKADRWEKVLNGEQP